MEEGFISCKGGYMTKLKITVVIIMFTVLFVMVAFTVAQDVLFLLVIGLYVLFTGKMVLDALEDL